MPNIQDALGKKGIYVTANGLNSVRKELEFLKNDKRIEVAQRLKAAREFGDLTENSEYDIALDEQTLIEKRISELEEILKTAKVISAVSETDSVVIGSTVVIEMDGKTDQFTIVGKVEADPFKKRISNESPVGTALLGAKVGQSVEVSTPQLKIRCKILEIK